MIGLFFCVFLIFAHVCNSFRFHTSISSSNTSLRNNYRDLLEQAKRKKLESKTGQSLSPSNQPIAPSNLQAQSNDGLNQQISQQATTASTISQMTTSAPSSSSKSTVGPVYPFSDEVYEHLKFVISTLTGKIKNEISLTSEDLERFRQSVDIIIADAYAGVPSETRVSSISTFTSERTINDADITRSSSVSTSTVSTIVSPPPAAVAADASTLDASRLPSNSISSESSNKNNNNDNKNPAEFQVFEKAFQGLASTWEIPNMENMSTEEYYQALNRRNAEIRRQRRQMHPPSNMNDFLNSLSRKNPSPPPST
jgi:hypothetical protein